MRVYYYFSVNDRFFTDATKEFKGSNNKHEFSGLAGGRRDFLDENINLFTSISYLSELSYEGEIDDNYLLDVEKNYNINISELISAERTFWRLEKKQRIKYAEVIIKQIEEDYLENKFNIIFSEGIDDFPSFFLHEFAKKKGIPFYYFVYSRFGGSMFLSDRKDTGPAGFETTFLKNKNLFASDSSKFNETKEFVEDYIKNKKQPYYVSQSSMLFRSWSFEDIFIIKKSLQNFFKDSKTYHAYENPLTFPFKRYLKIKRKKQYQNYFKGKFINLENISKQKFFVYPLHFHPEAATLIQGRWFNDQKAIIELVSRVLPANVKLIVKEHKVSIGRRPVSFYREINQFHNVYFVSENQDVYQMLNQSSGVVTISSSMGMEAIMLQKPVITFGDIHYNIISKVIKATDFSQMASYMKQALDFITYDNDEYWAFFKTITENCYDMSGYSPHKYTNQHISTFVEMLTKVLECENCDEQ